MRTILVTGASGLLGNSLIGSIRKDTLALPVHYTRQLHNASVRLDLTDFSEVSSFLGKRRPDVVVHTAAMTNVDRCETDQSLAWRTNVEGTRNVATQCNRIKAKMVYISTDYVFNGAKGYYREGDVTAPVNYYGSTKLEGEKAVQSICADYLILRTSVLYGWHPWKANFVTWLLDMLRKKREVLVVKDQFNTPTLAENLAEILIETLENDLRGIYHISGSQRISRYQFAKKVAGVFDLEESLIRSTTMSQMTAWTAERPKDSSLENEKIRKRIRTQPLDIAEGLARMEEGWKP